MRLVHTAARRLAGVSRAVVLVVAHQHRARLTAELRVAALAAVAEVGIAAGSGARHVRAAAHRLVAGVGRTRDRIRARRRTGHADACGALLGSVTEAAVVAVADHRARTAHRHARETRDRHACIVHRGIGSRVSRRRDAAVVVSTANRGQREQREQPGK